MRDELRHDRKTETQKNHLLNLFAFGKQLTTSYCDCSAPWTSSIQEFPLLCGALDLVHEKLPLLFSAEEIATDSLPVLFSASDIIHQKVPLLFGALDII